MASGATDDLRGGLKKRGTVHIPAGLTVRIVAAVTFTNLTALFNGVG
jgi:hypothetical protein